MNMNMEHPKDNTELRDIEIDLLDVLMAVSRLRRRAPYLPQGMKEELDGMVSGISRCVDLITDQRKAS